MQKQDYHVQTETQEATARRAPKRSRAAGTIVNDQILDAWWNQLSRERKIELYTNNRVIKLEGTVS